MKQNPFELFLDRLDPEWRNDQLAFFRTVAALGTQSIPELAERVHRVSCAPAFRRLVLEASYYHSWPEWLPVIIRTLRHEKDPGTFETGARALGHLGTPEALAALKDLAQSRATEPFRSILEQVLHESDPGEAFHHHYSRLLQGSAHPSEANEGAHQLEKLLSPEHLEPLKTLAGHPDLLVFRHALRLLSMIRSTETAEFLVQLLEEAHQDALEDREVRALLNTFRPLPRTEVRDHVVGELVRRWEERDPAAAADLGSGDPERTTRALRVIKDAQPTWLDEFLLGTLEAALEEKHAHLARHLTQVGDQAAQRARRLEFALDSAATGLADLAEGGYIPAEALFAPLAACLRDKTGRTGVATALARLVPPEARELQNVLVEESDGALRLAALEVLGARRDPGFRPALLVLRKDPIFDLAQRALWHLGQLPDPEAQAREWLDQADPEEIQVGLRFVLLHRLESLVPDLLKLVEAQPQEALVLATLQTLGGLGFPQAAEPLLAQLHSGQGPRIQVALAESLRDFSDPGVARSLCETVLNLPTAELHTVGVEALAKAHPLEGPPLPAEQGELLLALTRKAWEGRNPWALRRRIATALVALQLDSPAIWSELATLFQETLGEKRNPGAVATEDLTHLNASARALSQRAQG